MINHRSIVVVVAVVVGLCSVALESAELGVAPQATAPEGWPAQVDGRKLSRCEYGFVYARDKSALEEVREVLAVAVADAKSDGAGVLPAGLVLVVDTKEKYPCEIARLTEVLKRIDPNDSEGGLKTIMEAEKQSQDMGLEPDAILSIAPLQIPASALHESAPHFPVDADRQIGWCLVVPTEAHMKAGFKKMMDAALKKENPGLLKRATIAAAMPLMERQIMSMMTKGRQAGLYESLLRTQKDLSPEQRRAKVDAYKEKLGLKKKRDAAKPEPNAPDP
jgi:hypothetical protein